MTLEEKEELGALLIAARTAELEAQFKEEFVEELTEEASRDLQMRIDADLSDRKDLSQDPVAFSELVGNLVEEELDAMDDDIRERAANLAAKKAAACARETSKQVEHDLVDLLTPARTMPPVTADQEDPEEEVERPRIWTLSVAYTERFEHYYRKTLTTRVREVFSDDQISGMARFAAVEKASSLDELIAEERTLQRLRGPPPRLDEDDET